MNTYFKFAPNVYLAKCDEKHEKGEIIDVTTKYGKENESIVLILSLKEAAFSITPLFEQMASTFRNGLNVEQNEEENGLTQHL